MKSLINKIKLANAAYATGNPYLTDAEYDVLWQELHALDPHNPVLYHTGQDPMIPVDHIRHFTPIYGTQKAFSMTDLKPFLTRFKGVDLVIEPKYDGVAAMVYTHAKGCLLVLHGDGTKGRNISQHAAAINFTDTYRHCESVELIILNENWDKSFGKNPCNTVAGWINSYAGPDADIVHAVKHNNGQVGTIINSPSLEDLEDLLLKRYASWNKEYPMDGLMLKVRDPRLRLEVGNNGTVNLWSIAWKPPIQTAKTRVLAIHWNVSRSGRVVPKVEYEPIPLCGTTNRFATGNNAAWIRAKEIKPGSEITVGKAGEIIPKIIEVNNKFPYPNELPIKCPVCKNIITWSGKDLMCLADNCIVRLSKSLAYFYSDKGMDVKSIGEAMIMELLYDNEFRNFLISKPWALLDPLVYKLKETDTDLIPALRRIWGETKVWNYYDSWKVIDGKKNPAQFIAALGYPGLAYKTALKLCQATMLSEKPKSISSKAQRNFNHAALRLKEATGEFQNFTLAPLPKPAKITYCITGELSTGRAEMIDYLTTKQWQVSNGVTKSTDVLILGTVPHITTKQEAAIAKNILIITEDELAEFIKENS